MSQSPSQIPFGTRTPPYAVLSPYTGAAGLLSYRYPSGYYRVQIAQNVFRVFRYVQFLTEEQAIKLLPDINCGIYPIEQEPA